MNAKDELLKLAKGEDILAISLGDKGFVAQHGTKMPLFFKGEKPMSEPTIEKKLRYRVNISRGMKGSISFEATVDGENYTEDEILEKSDSLVAKLDQRYPASIS